MNESHEEGSLHLKGLRTESELTPEHIRTSKQVSQKRLGRGIIRGRTNHQRSRRCQVPQTTLSTGNGPMSSKSKLAGALNLLPASALESPNTIICRGSEERGIEAYSL